MSVLLQFRDQRLPPTISVDLHPHVEYSDSTGDDSDDMYPLSMSKDVHEIDEDQALRGLEKSTLDRNGSVGNSWGVTAVGRGFDWRWNPFKGSKEREPSKGEEPTHEDNDRPDSVLRVDGDNREDHEANGVSDAMDLSSTNPTPLRSSPSPDEKTYHLPIVGAQLAYSPFPLEMSQPASPSTDSLPPMTQSPQPTRRETSASRPIIAGRSQSMYIVPTAASPLAEEKQLAPLDTSVGSKAQRAKVWSRPVSPVRSQTLPKLAISPSAPALAGMNTLSAFTFTPLVITGGALMTPTTPRSPRLNRSRASQKRISLIAGREVAGVNLLDSDGLPNADEEDWLTFGRGRRMGSPTDSIGEDEAVTPSTPQRGDDDEGSDLYDPPMVPVRRGSQVSRRSRSGYQMETAQEDEGWAAGRTGQIKALGRFNSSLFATDGEGPPTPLRTPSFAALKEAAQRDAEKVEERPMSLNAGGFSTSGSLSSLVAHDLHIPAEVAPPVYPALDIPHPDWSLQRLSSSWSISTSAHRHQHRPSTASSLRRSDSKSSAGQSPEGTRGRDDVLVMMRRMKSSQSMKRMLSESRRGGFLGGRTIEDYVITGDAGRGAYGLVKRARERKKPLVEINEDGEEVIIEDVREDETVGPPLIIKQIIKSRILADCWKKHPIHGTIPIEIYVMSALSGTSYVLPKPRAWDPRRFEDPEDRTPPEGVSELTSISRASTMTVTPAATPRPVGGVGLSFTGIGALPSQEPLHVEEEEEITELDLWRWREGDLIKGHPNICPLEDFFEDSSFYYLVLPATKPSFPKMPLGMEDAIAIGSDRPPSDLFDLVEMYPSGLPGPLIRTYLGQIADALSFLHARGICHRDIKDENVVLGEHGRCWLIDFGSSGVVRKNGWDSFSGTLDYAAPEILHGARYAGPPQDVWAFGIVAYVLIVGECPFVSSAEAAMGLEDPEEKPALALRARCSGGPAGFDEGMEPDGGGRLGDAMELVRRCLELDVARRPTMEQVLTSRYLNGGQGWGQPMEVEDAAGVAN